MGVLCIVYSSKKIPQQRPNPNPEEKTLEHLFTGQPVLASQVDPGPQVVIVQAPAAMTGFPRIRFGEHPVNTICPNCQNQVS